MFITKDCSNAVNYDVILHMQNDLYVWAKVLELSRNLQYD